MTASLPDELLQEILDLVLHVPDELFEDVGIFSPFRSTTFSSADVLQVCSRWNGAGTSALYDTVVIRSSAQAWSLGATLASHSSLGSRVRRFRLEISCPMYLTRAVLSAMPNVAHTIVPLDIYENAPIPTDIEFILKHWRFSRLGLVSYYDDIEPSPSSEILGMLEQAIPMLPLTSFSCSFDDWEALLHELGPTLSECPTLTYVNIRTADFFDSHPGTMFAHLLSNPTLQLTIIYNSIYTLYFNPRESVAEKWRDVEEANGRVRCIWNGGSYLIGADYSDFPLPKPKSDEDSGWVPMRLASRETRVHVWHLIVGHSLELPPERLQWHDTKSWFTSYSHNLSTARNTLIASRELYDATIRALFTELVVKNSTRDICQVAAHLSRDHELTNILRTFELHHEPTIPSQVDLGAFKAIFNAADKFSRLNHLVLRGWVPAGAVPLDHLTRIGPAVGRSLGSFYLYGKGGWANTTLVDPIAFFGAFEVLETLMWESKAIRFTTGGLQSGSGFLGLEKLAKLYVLACHPSLLEVLGSLSLPNLATVNLYPEVPSAHAWTFLKKHGKKIRKVDTVFDASQLFFDLLPNLEELTLSINTGVLPNVCVPSVVKIRLSWNGWELNSGSYAAVIPHLVRQAPKNFPRLREVWLQRDWWPNSEREESRSPWPVLSDLLAKSGLVFKDADGRVWRKRLTVRPTLNDNDV